jgi:hypothetical protein
LLRGLCVFYCCYFEKSKYLGWARAFYKRNSWHFSYCISVAIWLYKSHLCGGSMLNFFGGISL